MSILIYTSLDGTRRLRFAAPDVIGRIAPKDGVCKYNKSITIENLSEYSRHIH